MDFFATALYDKQRYLLMESILFLISDRKHGRIVVPKANEHLTDTHPIDHFQFTNGSPITDILNIVGAKWYPFTRVLEDEFRDGPNASFFTRKGSLQSKT